MAKILSIVERAFQGTLEEQDDTALWLNAALAAKNPDITVLLRGNAVHYAVKGQDASGLRFGGVPFGAPPHLEADLGLLQERSVPVLVLAEDLADRGVGLDRLVPGVRPLAKEDLASFVGGFGHVWYW